MNSDSLHIKSLWKQIRFLLLNALIMAPCFINAMEDNQSNPPSYTQQNQLSVPAKQSKDNTNNKEQEPTQRVEITGIEGKQEAVKTDSQDLIIKDVFKNKKIRDQKELAQYCSILTEQNSPLKELFEAETIYIKDEQFIKEPITDIKLMPDDKTVIVVTMQHVRYFDLTTKKWIKEKKFAPHFYDYFYNAAISPDSSFMVCVGKGGKGLLYSLQEDKVISEMNYRSEVPEFELPLISPDSNFFIIHTGGTIYVYKKSGELIDKIECSKQSFNRYHRIAFSINGAELLIINMDKIYVYDLQTKQCHKEFTLQPNANQSSPNLYITAAIALPNNQLLCAANDDGAIYLHNLTTDTTQHIATVNQKINRLYYAPCANQKAHLVAVSRSNNLSGELIAINNIGTPQQMIYSIDLTPGPGTNIFDHIEQWPYQQCAATVSSDGTKIVVCTMDAQFKEYNITKVLLNTTPQEIIKRVKKLPLAQQVLLLAYDKQLEDANQQLPNKQPKENKLVSQLKDTFEQMQQTGPVKKLKELIKWGKKEKVPKETPAASLPIEVDLASFEGLLISVMDPLIRDFMIAEKIIELKNRKNKK